jgi:hypothetical protein
MAIKGKEKNQVHLTEESNCFVFFSSPIDAALINRYL